MTRLTILFVLVILFHENCGQMHQTFFKNGIFKTPSNYLHLYIVTVGGGGGGGNGPMSGGAGGYIYCTAAHWPENQEYAIVVGKGGRGADTTINSKDVEGCTDGGTSSFGNGVSAAGGKGCNNKINGNNGGTGSGAACWGANGGECSGPDAMGGRGGTGGSDGGASSDGIKGGKGWGVHGFEACYRYAKWVKLTAGEGGIAADANCKDDAGVCWGAGSGGGGVLVNGEGPAANDGQAINPKLAGEGGKGYGAGGGGGGYQKVGGVDYNFGGGNGNDGFVHVEIVYSKQTRYW